ncbi:MAG TPA: DUF5694 domain-containing protein [Pyrinomonadaceae bacterium]|nr:DUF5694 domain-containing protein [Pyrinomonadaceae bacterium]
MFNRLLLILVLMTGCTIAAVAQGQSSEKPARAEVLVLGVYHMANPGQDIFNMKADDVLAPKRQTEIGQLIEVLKRFQPTKIAIESSIWSKRAPQQYSDYLAGKYTMSRNENDQIGYRLAKEMGHKTIYPVDVDGDFPFPRLVNYAKGKGRSKEMDALMAEVGEMVKAQDQYLQSHTVLEMLMDMNSDEKVAAGVAFYFRQAHLGEPGDWAGADLIADWYRRNIRIYSNIAQLVESPNERILVIYGAGHLGWLQQMFTSDPTFRLRKLAEFVK